MKESGSGAAAMGEGLGVYLSVPFCRAKCTYCNFASGVFGEGRLGEYVARLCGEIRGARANVPKGARLPGVVDSVYFGGGTPSLLEPESVREIFAALRGEFEVAREAEVTLECAPRQLGDETLAELQRQGMNRVSLGVQSFADREAKAVGRLHTRAMCVEEIARLRAAGVGNVNVDLIAGLPWQTRESLRESVEELVGTGVPHASVYMLEVDGDSRLGRELLAEGERYGAGAVPGEDETAEWYGLACEWLAGAGIGQYEISNFAREGFQSRHNMKYWRREPYVGFGLDAHSMLRVEGSAEVVRWANGEELEGYLRQGARDEVRGARDLMRVVGQGSAPGVERVGRVAGFEEAMFLGLRMNEGVELAGLRAEFGDGLVEEALRSVREMDGLVEVVEGRVRLTGRGREVSNEVFERVLVEA